MSGRQQRVMVQPIVSVFSTLKQLTWPMKQPVECNFQNSSASAWFRRPFLHLLTLFFRDNEFPYGSMTTWECGLKAGSLCVYLFPKTHLFAVVFNALKKGSLTPFFPAMFTGIR